MRDIASPRMKETTCKKLQEIGAFALAGGCTRKRMKQLVEMIRAAQDYRWVAVYKIIKNEFVILAETGNEPAAYARFPISQGLCGAGLSRITATARATSTAEIGEVLPPPIGSANSSEARTPGPAS